MINIHKAFESGSIWHIKPKMLLVSLLKVNVSLELILMTSGWLISDMGPFLATVIHSNEFSSRVFSFYKLNIFKECINSWIDEMTWILLASHLLLWCTDGRIKPALTAPSFGTWRILEQWLHQMDKEPILTDWSHQHTRPCRQRRKPTGRKHQGRQGCRDAVQP